MVPMMTTSQAAGRLNKTARTVARYCRTGVLSPVFKVAGGYLIETSVLERYIARHAFVPLEVPKRTKTDCDEDFRSAFAAVTR